MLTNLLSIGPELALTATVVLVLLADLALGNRAARRGTLATLATLGLAAAGAAFAMLPDAPTSFDGLLSGDGLGVFFRGLFLLAAFFGVAFGALSDEVPESRFGEFAALLLSTTLGMAFLVQARNLLMIVLALELTSLPAYVLAGFRRGDRRSSEAALKYVLYGAAASGLMLYGFSLIYGLAGTLELSKVGPALAAKAAGGSIGVRAGIAIAGLFALVGYGYKIAAVPFHQWCPDVYEGAPTPVTAFLSVGPKAAGVAALIRFVGDGFGATATAQALPGALPWPIIVGVLSIATMTLGNLAAIAQDNVKRLLAYSSIAHAGYLLMGVAVGTPGAVQAVALYAPVYLLMNLGAFLAVLAVRAKSGAETFAAYRGLGARSPLLAIALAIFLFSLTGLPPFAGFIGKFYLFAAVLEVRTPFFYVLAVAGVLNSVVSLYYYARLVKAMFLESAPGLAPVAVPAPAVALLAVLAVPTMILGLWWSPLAALAAKAAGIAG